MLVPLKVEWIVRAHATIKNYIVRLSGSLGNQRHQQMMQMPNLIFSKIGPLIVILACSIVTR